jgi:hypothetical protein
MADLVREMSGEMTGESETRRGCVGLYDLEKISESVQGRAGEGGASDLFENQ